MNTTVNTTSTPKTTGFTSDISTAFEGLEDILVKAGLISSDATTTPDSSQFNFNLSLSVIAFAPRGAGTDFEVRLAEVTTKLKEVTADVKENEMVAKEETKRLNIQANQEKIEDAENKLDEAQAKRKKASFWDKVSGWAQAIGGALMMALAVVAVVGSFGVAAPVAAALFIGGAAMTFTAANSLAAQYDKDGLGFAGQIARAQGKDLEEAQKIDGDWAIAFAVTAAVIAIATIPLTFGAGGAAAIVQVTSAVGAVSGAVGATAAAGSAIIKHDAAETQADAAELQAESNEIQAFM